VLRTAAAAHSRGMRSLLAARYDLGLASGASVGGPGRRRETPPGSRALSLLIALGGCQPSTPGAEVLVDLRTDFRVPTDFVRVETTLEPAMASDAGVDLVRRDREEVSGVSAAALLEGVRIAEFDRIPAGTHVVAVRLLDAAGAPSGARSVRVAVTSNGRTAVTVVISRSCAGVPCPAPGGDPRATECLGGRCVPPECVGEPGEGCGEPACTGDASCPTGVACVRGRCAAGACLLVPDDALCTADVGGRCDPDAGCLYSGCTAGSCDDGQPCTADECTDGGCTFTPIDDLPCDDGIFCNGADGCRAGVCTTHAGDPCGGTTACDEAGRACGDCVTDGDCPPDAVGAFGPCDYASTCDETAMQSRSVMRFDCTGRVCSGRLDTETTPCSRSTGGTVCGAPTTGAWGACGYGDACDESAERSRTVTSYACAAGSCRSSAMIDREACSRSTDGASCGGGRTCLGAECCTGLCGDANQDGSVDVADSLRAMVIADGTFTPTECAREDGDVVRNGAVSRGDATLILQGDVGLVDLSTGCGSNCGSCGDANQDMTVDVADALRIMSMIGDGVADPVCGYWAGNVDGDADLDSDDATRLQNFLVGLATLSCLPK
jgi:hypothetical protein